MRGVNGTGLADLYRYVWLPEIRKIPDLSPYYAKMVFFLVVAAIAVFVISAGSDAEEVAIQFTHNNKLYTIKQEINGTIDDMSYQDVSRMHVSFAEKYAKAVYATSPPVEDLDFPGEEWSSDEL
ncbi:hypothetical protein Ddc_15662 [Ditylenchus destructor]|nr:hypothetical protein Ddc_15662 [Ditylenchus destructor]